MILLLLISTCLFSVLSVALVAVPGEARSLMISNCQDGRGRIRLRYLLKEAKTLADFFGETFFWAVIAALCLLPLLAFANDYLRLDLLARAVMVADVDGDQWRDNLKTSDGNLVQQYSNHLSGLGATRETSRSIMHGLWMAFPIAVVVCFALLMGIMLLTSKQYGNGLRTLIERETARQHRRMRRRYLRSTAQAQMQQH